MGWGLYDALGVAEGTAVDAERKIYLSFLLKDLFTKDQMPNIYKEELSNILKQINPDEIPEQYQEIVNQNIDPNFFDSKKIKFDNSILHKSKIIRHFFDNYEKTSRTEKDFNIRADRDVNIESGRHINIKTHTTKSTSPETQPKSTVDLDDVSGNVNFDVAGRFKVVSTDGTDLTTAQSYLSFNYKEDIPNTVEHSQ